MKLFRTLLKLVRREIGLIIPDRNLISVLLIAPLFYSFFYGSIYYNKVETDVPVVVVDQDQSTTSRKFIRMLDASQLVKVTKDACDMNSAKKEIISGNAHAIIFIPANFEAELKSGKGSDLKSFLNTSRFLISNDINKAVNEVSATLGAGIRLKYFQALGYNLEQAKELVEPVKVEIRPMFNYTESYGDFLVPSVLIIILHQTLLLGLSESVAKEREQKTISSLFSYADNNIPTAIIGKGLFYVMLYSVYTTFFFSVNFYIFKLPFNGSVAPFILLTILMLTAVVFMSIFISSFFERKIIAMQFLTLSSYPVFLISGYSWPFEFLPLPIKAWANVIPFTPYSSSVIKLTMMGGGFANVYTQIIHLFILAIIFFAAAYYRMNHLFKTTQLQNI
ncbi:MAG: ABC transporter permease [Melioribacteraceae bacterium]